MFEAQAAYYLNKYLGQYVEGVDTESLSISVWKGDVQLKNLRIRPEALAGLHLPLSVSAGILGSLRLKVPWTKLGKEPVIVEIDKLYILATPLVDTYDKPSDNSVVKFEEELVEKERLRKRSRVDAVEADWIQKLSSKQNKSNTPGDGSDDGFIKYYIDTVLGNLEIKITNIHIRYEDNRTTFGQNFAFGFCLSELSAFTVDDTGSRAFITAKGQQSHRKSMKLERLALYFESDPDFFAPEAPWLSLSIEKWDSLFLPAIGKGYPITEYLLRPIDGDLQYAKKRNIAGETPTAASANEPLLKINLHLKEVGLSFSRNQYLHTRNLLAIVNLYQLTILHRHLRPPFRPKSPESARAWWRYGLKAIKFSVLGMRSDTISLKEICKLRKSYVPLYAEALREGKIGGTKVTRNMDDRLSETSILMFRQMAHLEVEKEKRKALAIEQEKQTKSNESSSGWLSWIWGSSTATPEAGSHINTENYYNKEKQTLDSYHIGEDSERSRYRKMTDEEWGQLQELLGNDIEKDEVESSDIDAIQMRFLLEIDTCSAILSHDKQEVLYGSLSRVISNIDHSRKSTYFTLSISSAAVSSAKQSVMRTMQSNSDSIIISLNYPYRYKATNLPIALDIKTTSTCYLYDSGVVDKISSFFKSEDKNELSALEAKAAASLMKARSMAQKTIEQDFSDGPTLKLCVDMKAPKIAIPSKGLSTLVVDLGCLEVKSCESSDRHYERFHTDISEVSVYVIDDKFDWKDKEDTSEKSSKLAIEAANKFFFSNTNTTLQILEKCAFKTDLYISRNLKDHKIIPCKLEWVIPSIRLHISPGRYRRIMEVMYSFMKSNDEPMDKQGPRDIDIILKGNAKMLTREGLTGLTYKWRSYGLELGKGGFYVLKGDRSVQRWIRLDEQICIYLIKPTNIFGKKNVLGVLPKGVHPKDATEEASSLIIMFDSEQEVSKWKTELLTAQKQNVLLQHGDQLHYSFVAEETPKVEEKSISLLTLLSASGSVEEICINVYGRPPTKKLESYSKISKEFFAKSIGSEIVILDDEIPLVVFREEEGRAKINYGPEGLEAELAVKKCMIEDLLKGAISGKPSYIAHSQSPVISSDDDSIKLYFSIDYKNTESKKAKTELTFEFAEIELEWHRATIASLITIGTDFAAASEASAQLLENQISESSSDVEMSKTSDMTAFMTTTEKNTLVFKFGIVTRKVQLTLPYENETEGFMTQTVFTNFKFAFNMFPSNFAIDASLGNIIIYDGALETTNPYYQMCGLKNLKESADEMAHTESLVEVDFTFHTVADSYKEDRIPSGSSYYALKANISEIEIIFFYRFLNEFLVYLFSTFAMSPDTDPQNEDNTVTTSIATTALKAMGVDLDIASTLVLLDIGITSPLVKIPQDPESQNFFQGTFGSIKVTNYFERPKFTSLLDNIKISLSGVCANAICNGQTGANLIRDMGHGISVNIRRVIRDTENILPNFSCSVSLETLEAEMSDAEYEFLQSTLQMNFGSTPRIPKDAKAITELVYPEVKDLYGNIRKSISNSSTAAATTYMEVSICLYSAKLTLTNSMTSGSLIIPLASITLEGLTCDYVAHPKSGTTISASIPLLEATDLRSGAADNNCKVLSRGTSKSQVQDMDGCVADLISMKYCSFDDTSDIDIRLQEPVLTLELGFVFAITKFFMPHIELGVSPKEFQTKEIRLGMEPFVADSDIFLSPEFRILADAPDIDYFVFDGNKHKIVLPSNASPRESAPLILVGPGKTLKFKNTSIINCASLGSISQIKSGARILCKPEDGMLFVEKDKSLDFYSNCRVNRSVQRITDSTDYDVEATNTKFNINVVATSGSLRIIDIREKKEKEKTKHQKMFLAEFDTTFCYLSNGSDYTMQAKIHRFLLDAVISTQTAITSGLECLSSPVRVLEPLWATASYSYENSVCNIDIKVGNVTATVPLDLLDLALDIQRIVLDPMTVPSPDEPFALCSRFNLIWTSKIDQSLPFNNESSGNERFISFWHPQAPPGYVILGDVFINSQAQCTREVMAIALNSGLVSFPLSFQKAAEYNGLTIWKPLPSPGYVAMGYIAMACPESPRNTTCVCVHEHYLVDAAIGEYFKLCENQNFWSVENSGSTFILNSSNEPEMVFDIRSPIGITPYALQLSQKALTASLSSDMMEQSENAFLSYRTSRLQLMMDQEIVHYSSLTIDFKKIAIFPIAKKGSGAGIWRPIPPPGYVIVGDYLNLADEAPPRYCTVWYDTPPSALTARTFEPPIEFTLLWQNTTLNKQHTLNIWLPVAKEGYIALGCVATVGKNKPDPSQFRCIRCEVSELIPGGVCPFSAKLKHYRDDFFAWITDQKTGSFFVSSDSARPPSRDMRRIRHTEKSKSRRSSLNNDEFYFDLKCGPLSVQLLNTDHMPTIEMEARNISLLSEQKEMLLKSYATCDASIWSYNLPLKSWEPVIETTHLICHIFKNSSSTEKDNIAPGISVKVASTGDSVQLTVAMSTLKMLMEMQKQWQYINSKKSGLVYQLPAANSVAVGSLVTNSLGRQLQLLCDFGTEQKTFILSDNQEVQKLTQPLPLPPARKFQSDNDKDYTEIFTVGVCDFKLDAEVKQIATFSCNVTIENEEGLISNSTRFRRCDEAGYVCWNEKFLLKNIRHFQNKQIFLEQQEEMESAKYLKFEISRSCSGCPKEAFGSERLDIGTICKGKSRINFFEILIRNEAEGVSGKIRIYLSFEKEANLHLKKKDVNRLTQGERALRFESEKDWTPIPSEISQKSSVSVGVLRSSLISPVSLPEGSVIVETNFVEGIKNELFRSTCTFVNSTELPLEIRLMEINKKGWNIVREKSRSLYTEVQEEQVFEHDRFTPIRGWGSLFPSDRKRYSQMSSGSKSTSTFPVINLEPGWTWDGPWQLDLSGHVDKDGWAYASDFSLMKYPPKKGSEKKSMVDFTKRRRWVRKKRKNKEALMQPRSSKEGVCDILGIIERGGKMPLPFNWNLLDYELQVRPLIKGDYFHQWSLITNSDNHRLPLKSLKDGVTNLACCHKLASDVTNDNSFNDEDWLQCSDFWFGLMYEGEPLQSGIKSTTITDWTITARAPIILKNSLPFTGVFIIWERTGQGHDTSMSMLKLKQQGNAVTESTTNIHAADPRQELCLTFTFNDHQFVQDEPVTISFGHSQAEAGAAGPQQLPNSFAMNTKNGRTDVLIERLICDDLNLKNENAVDPGAAVAAGIPISLRLYVPLWVINNLKVPINIGILKIKDKKENKISKGDENGGSTSDLNTKLMPEVVRTSYQTNDWERTQFLTYMKVDPLSTEILCYPTGIVGAIGVKMAVVGSEWTPPLPLATSAASRNEAVLESDTKMDSRIAVRAEVPETGVIYSFVASLDVAGSGFMLTKVLKIYPDTYFANHTNMPLSILSPRSDDYQGSKEYLGIFPRNTTIELTRQRASESSYEKSKESALILAPGEIHEMNWKMGREEGIVKISADRSWSQSFYLNREKEDIIHILLPLSTASGRQYLKPASVDQSKASAIVENTTILKIKTQQTSPGCLCVILVSVYSMPPFVLENKTRFNLAYRQRGGKEWLLLPSLAAQGWIAVNTLKQSHELLEISEDTSMPDKPCVAVCISDEYVSERKKDLTAEEKSEEMVSCTDNKLNLQDKKDYAIIEVIDAGDAADLYLSSNNSSSKSKQIWSSERLIRVLPGLLSSKTSQNMISHKSLTEYSEFKLTIDSVVVSIVDQTPRELLLISAQDITFNTIYGRTVKGRYVQIRMRVQSLQIDDQLPYSFYPVMCAPWIQKGITGFRTPSISFAMIQDIDHHHGRVRYPAIHCKIGDLQISVHEPVVWKVLDAIELLSLTQETNNTSAYSQVSSDPDTNVLFLRIAGVAVKVAALTDPSSRPRRAATKVLSLGLRFANVEDVKVQLSGFEAERLAARASILTQRVTDHFKDQLWKVVLNVLDFYISISGVSQALSAFGKVIKTAVDNKEEGKQKKEGETSISSSSFTQQKVGSLQSGIFGGTEVLAKSIFKGVTGIVKEPLQGAKKHGVTGFVKGMGQGIMGVATESLGGAFEAVSYVTKGVDALKDDLASKVMGRVDEVSARYRLPRCISTDRIIRPYDAASAAGQYLANVAFLLSSGRRSNEALLNKEAFEGHCVMTENSILLWTSHRIALLKGSNLGLWHQRIIEGSVTAKNNIPDLSVSWTLLWTEFLGANLEGFLKNGNTIYALVIYKKLSISEPSIQSKKIDCSFGTTHVREIQRRLWSHAFQSAIADTKMAIMLKKHPDEVDIENAPFTMPSEEYLLVWISQNISVWNPIACQGYIALTPVIMIGYLPPSQPVPTFLDDSSSAFTDSSKSPRLALPVAHDLLFYSSDSQTGPFTIWSPVAPPGYSTMGCVVVTSLELPALDAARCLRDDLCYITSHNKAPIWQERDPEGVECCLYTKTDDSLRSATAKRVKSAPENLKAVVPSLEALGIDLLK